MNAPACNNAQVVTHVEDWDAGGRILAARFMSDLENIAVMLKLSANLRSTSSDEKWLPSTAQA